MKRKNIIKGLAVFASLALLPACSSDYLDIRPESNVSDAEAAATVDNCELAVNGLAMSMSTQYQSTDWNQFNGETYVNTICDDSFGQDYLGGLLPAMMGNSIYAKNTLENPDNLMNVIVWDYSYNLINQANLILSKIDDAEGDDAKRKFIKAQLLTFRAHAYTKLLQFYAPRWENSDNGDVYCVVYRDTPEVKDAPLCTMNQALDLIYSDLNTAIELYTESGLTRRAKFHPDLNIAYGVFARIALVKHDYAKAQEMARLAREGYKVMDEKTYMSGFYHDNDDFMWTTSDRDEELYYWSWGSHYAANGLYTKNWGIGAGAIDLTLYNQLDEKDIRRKMYITPDKIQALLDVNKAWNPGKIDESAFWNGKLVGAGNNLTLNAGPFARPKDKSEWGLYNIALRYCHYYVNNLFTGTLSEIYDPTDPFYAYFSLSNKGDVLLAAENGVSYYGTLVVCPFGAQLKFFSYAPYGTGTNSLMRAAEMCLCEAEAAYKNGDEATARKCLNEINTKRIANYSCTKSGDALWQEIMLTRRIELWGEGHNFTDFKRWNIPIHREAWEEGNPKSGNWMVERAVDVPVDQWGGWRFTVPNTESNYNKAVDRNLLNYNGV